MHLYYADIIANDILQTLQPHCSIINIAGSVRRRKQEVGDIELVLIPKKTLVEEKNLFGEVIRTTIVIDPDFETKVKAMGRILKGKTTGRQMQVQITRVIETIEHNIMLDIFMPQAHDYYRIYAIRTGSSDYAKKYIAGAWRNKGWVGTEHGLRLMKECYQLDEKKWALKSDIAYPQLPPVWTSEKEFFNWLGVQYLEPYDRNL
jgi:DNA polymerase/3'-5' exonuclease PolX